MKKLIIFTIVTMVTLAAYSTTGIQVIKPAANTKLFHGSTNDYMIKWLVTGQINKYVKIRLYDKTGATKIYSITDKTLSAKGEFPWPKDKINNTNVGDYVIRVKTLDNIYSDESGIFHIKKKPSLIINNPKLTKVPVIKVSDLLGLIKVTSPASGAYKVNEPVTINWDKNFGNYPMVNISLYGADNTMKEGLNTPNDGSYTWNPDKKYSWPGTKYYIKVKTSDNKFEGKSGIFTIFNPVSAPSQPIKKTLARTPSIANKKTSHFANSGEPECLSFGMDLPGRNAKPKEIKVGHWKRKSKGVKCDWVLREYYFTSNLDFDISPAASKEIIRAELLLTLSNMHEYYPQGDEAGTNTYCSSSSRVFRGNTLLKLFSVYEEGKHVKIDLLDSVKNWAALNQTIPYSITIKGLNDNVPITKSECLKYYTGAILFVEYKE